MKQSVDLMNSMKLMNSRHSYTTTTTTSLARRALLLLTLFVMSVGSAWGAEEAVTYSGYSGWQKANKSQFADVEEGTVLRIYESANNGLYTAYENSGWQNIFGGYWTPTNDQWNSTKVWGTYTGCAEITLTSAEANLLKNYDFIFGPNGGQTIYALTIENPAADTFLGSEASGATKESESKEIAKGTSTPQSFDLTGVSLTGVKYARIYLADASGNALADQSLLTVTYDGSAAVSAGSSTKNGVYVYNSGNNLDLSKVIITLNAGTGNFANYQIKCLLSTSTGTPAAGPTLTKEPDWNLTYSYTFTYPVEEIEVPLSLDGLLTDHLELNYHNIAEAKLKELSGSSSVTSFYGRWFVRNKTTGVRQALVFGSTAQTSNWAIQMGYHSGYFDGNSNGCTITDNVGEYGKTSVDWTYEQMFGWFRVCIPTSIGTKMLNASDYEIVFECTDDYSGGTPVMKLRYIFQFPEIGDFEGEANAGATETSSTQTVDRDATSVAVGVTTQATGAKYARFYVTDAQGTVVNPTSILEVKYNDVAATACTNVNSGFYIYNAGNAFDVSKISVSLKAPKLYKTYKVVALYSTALAKMTYAGGAMIEEPDYDNKHTYTFDYTITTNNQEPQIEWDATAMETDATTTDLDVNWKTSLAEMAAGQCIKWWVENGSGVKQALAIGTGRQSGTWTIGLPTGFVVAENIAALSGLTSIDAGQLESFVKTNVYAPSDKTYADVNDYKIVCEVYTNNAGTGNPNARYTFSLHKGFVGSLKSTASTATKRIKPAAGVLSNTISVALPAGTKYLRAWLTDADGTVVDPTGKLSITGEKDILSSVDGYSVNLGSYIYNSTGLTSPASVTLTLTAAELDKYNVVVATSADAAVLSGDDVTSEPDFDTQTTYWFKYPAAVKKNLEAHVEWSAQSMQLVKPDIEATENLGAGYLANNVKHYTMQWYVQDDDGIQNLRAGNSRVNDYWSINVNGDPFTIENKTASVVNNANLSSTTWNNWAAPVFYAPKNKTLRELAEKNTRFICKFYEDDETPLDDVNLLTMTYTVYIDRTEPLGELKDGGKRDGETIVPSASPMTLSLADAEAAFTSKVGGKIRYARVYLTKNDGTPLDPTTGPEKLTVTGSIPFTTATYGYYLSDENGITLPTDNTLTLPDGKFNFYNVVVAMSGDTGETTHTGAFSRELGNRAANVTLTTYEPDYDLIYTIKFKETSTFPGTWIGEDGIKHAKEILVENESVTEITMPLSESITKIKSEYGVADFATLAANLHVRWYIAKKNTDGDYVKIPGSENYLIPVNTSQGHQTETDQGVYWNAVTSGKTADNSDVSKVLDMKITKPSATDSWEDYRVVVYMKYVAADKDEYPEYAPDPEDNKWGLESTTQTISGGKVTHEPDNLDMQYIYNFFIEDDVNFQFVHAPGESNWPYITNSDDSRIGATVQQYSWDNTTGTKEAQSGDFRQGVHTVEYDIYVDPTSSTPVALKLPFQNYFGSGNNLEPTAYIRWYDWTTDVNNNRLVINGTYLEDKTENNNGSNVSRGFFLLNNQKNGFSPTHSNVGVTFNPKGLTGTVTIACDVSKYYDGIYSSNTLMDTRTDFTSYKKPYLMHEPTLSTRYIFNIRPASVIATTIQVGQDKLDAKGSNMFELAEDNGRVSVATNGTGTTFSIRANLSELNDYYIYNGAAMVQCNTLQWYAYFEDETGIYRNDTKLTTEDYDESKRISRIKMSALSGTYTHITTSASKSVTATAGQRYHLVGYIGNGTVMAPVVHYEINLIDAPAYAVDDLNLPLERTEAYLRAHMTLQATVDFDGMCGTPLGSGISTQSENHSLSPMSWSEAQYGFCYPDVRRIHAGMGNDYMGISPLHGDYMLLRSMNLAGISPSETGGLDYYYHWWASNLLYDYTYYYGLEHKGENGSFLYVDASDESRTIAQMSFNADLCAGSELCFTGVIADMTGGQVKPQVMSTVYAVKTNGTKVRVVSFHSSNLSTTAAGTYTTGKWYQVYGRVAIPATVDLSNVDHYEVNIDNYSPGTDGADYAVDQLQFYTSTAKLKVKQSGVNCGDVAVPLNLYVEAEQISGMAGKNIFWRICDQDGNPMPASLKLYDDAGTLAYGTTAVPATLPATIPVEASLAYPGSGYFTGSDGKLYFSLANKDFALKEGGDYYVSVYSMSETSVAYENLWGNASNECSVFSPMFIPKVMYLTMEDDLHKQVTTVPGGCSDKKAAVSLNVVLNMPDDNEVSGFKQYDAVTYDYFLGTLDDARGYKITVGGTDYKLIDALAHYRNRGGVSGSDTYKTATTLESSYESVNKNYYDVIYQAITVGKLFLSCSAKFSQTIQGDADNKAYVAALPTIDKVNNGTNDFLICTPLEYIFNVDASGNAPSLTLGFEDVTYPDGIRVVRVGVEQLTNMQKDSGGFLLHIPINTFKKNNSATAKDGTLQIQGDLELLAYKSGADQTSDGQISANINKVATFEAKDISSTQMYVSVNFHGTGVFKPTFQEGFVYRMFFQFRDKDDATACEGSTEFLMKVVPEFVTWNGTSTEWNSDANWQRSTRAELYKGTKSSATNTATAGHPDGYENNGEGTLSTVVTTPKTFVPMKFTYVTLPTGLQAPNLVNLTCDTKGIYDNLGSGATANIQYDLMVRYTEKTCQDHGVSGSVYDCEKFYGNWAKELYMKPNAELLNQQYLTYEKVWVEKELDANAWTLMSTPLQNTYAGDMYVPVSATAADNGRQTSEAFQPITFSTTTNAAGFTYSRTKYPIYQKGWTQEGVYVKTKTNDIRATQYSANIPGGVSTILNQWSHSYNDVTVPYSTWTAFAIRPHKKDQTAKTLIRLPKADTSYDYYQWDNTSPDAGKLTQNVAKETTGKLLTDGTANISGVTYGTVYGSNDRTASDGNYNALVANVQSSPANYQLVGNPYLCSIDMATFISENAANLDGAAQGYWTYDNNSTGTPIGNGYIAPMQSFFVKVKDGATGVIFKPSMMVDGHTVTSAPAREFTLMATNERGASAATVSVGEETKSVETLFDSNLADVPMVYTVADGQAVSINQVKELSKPIAFGVTCTASNEMVDVTFSDIEKLTSGEVYVVDAVDGTSQQIYEGDSFAVQPNDYGRYFLTFTGGSATGIEETASPQQGIVVSVRGREVTVTSGEEISQIQAVSLNGSTIYQNNNCGNSVTFMLHTGVYVIQAKNTAGAQQDVKIFVK